MNYIDIRELSVHRGPSVSMYVSCGDPLQFAQKWDAACSRALELVQAQIDPEDAKFVCESIESVRSRSVEHTAMQSVVLFANQFVAWMYPLPFVVDDVTIIGSMFVLQPLEQYLNRTIRYWVLVLFKGTPFLLEGYPDHLIELIHRHNSVDGEQMYDVIDAAGNVCEQVWGKHCRYASQQEFISIVDGYLQHFLIGDPIPLVVIADAESLASFQKYSEYTERAVMTHAITSLLNLSEMHTLIWASFKKAYGHLADAWGRKIISLTTEARAFGVNEVWDALNRRRVIAICVSKGLEHSACELPIATQFTDDDLCRDGSKVDAVDRIISRAMLRGISVYWCDPVLLKDHRDIVAAVAIDDPEFAR